MTLDEEYQKAIDDQRSHLLKVQDDFNKICDEARDKAEAKLKEIPESDKEGREAVLQEQKDTLEEALKKLKMEVDHSTRMTMKRLEEVVRKKEEQILADLEKQMASL